MTKYFLLFIISLWQLFSYANDECVNAVTLTPATTCVNTTGSFSGMTMSTAAPSCGSGSLQDVWYKFTATDSTMSVNLGATSGLNHGFEIIQGNCSGTVLACVNNYGFGYAESYFNNNFIPGQVYYVRVFNASASLTTLSFTICVQKFPVPANDLCGNATTLTPGTACTNTTGTFSGAMMNGSMPSCGSGSLQDVWYKFTATDSTMSVSLGATSGLNHGFEIIQGSCSGAVVVCMNNYGFGYAESYFNNNFIPGQVYYVRVFNASAALTTLSFTICVQKFPSPANDFCSNATTLTPGVTCGTITGTFSGAMMNGSIPSCAPNVSQDVWYKFTATDSTYSVDLDAISGLNHGFEIIQGSCNGTVLICRNNNGISYNESYFGNIFIPGQVYYVRVFNASANLSTTSFTLCIRKYPSPSNDLCSNATTITPGTSCGTITGTFSGAMMNGSVPSCAPNASQDVWYKFTATDSTYSIDLDAISGMNHGFEIIQGSCNGTVLLCKNDNGISYNESYFSNTFIPGQVYYVRVFNASANLSATSFTFCIRKYPSPSNDLCSNATTVTPGTTCGTITGTFSGAMMNGSVPSCAPNASQDVWYKFTATDSTYSIDLDAIYGMNHGFEIIQGSCNGTVLLCKNDNGVSYSESYFSNTFIPGQVYYVRVFNASANLSATSFTFCIRKYPNPSNDLCSNATTVTPGTTCGNIAGTFSGAMMNGSVPSCAPNASQDVWYKFTATDSTYSIDLDAIYGMNHGFEIIQGSCNGTVLICKNDNGISYSESYLGNIFIPGQVYYVRVFNASANLSATSFILCIRKYPSPSNDRCSAAIELTPANSCNYIYGSFSGAMMNGGVPSCAPNTSQDVWYKFTATAASMVIQLSAVSGMNHGFQVFEGSCGGAQISCVNANGISYSESGTITGLTIGQTYFVRVINASSALNINTFGICLTGPPPSACTPSVVISTSVTSICQGESVTFTAVPTYGGTAPTYQWKVNGGIVGTNSPTYTTTTLTNGSIVSCVMVSNAVCAATTSATSNTITMTVTANTVPSFTQVAAICSGGSFTLPTTSNNGITGTWSPAINNTTTTTYTFTSNASGQCISPATMTVTVNNGVLPTFTQVPAICSGGSFTLPATSNNGISGSWSPAINNTATTTYTFTPNTGQCATTASMTVTVNSASTVPTFNQVPAICSGGSFTLPATSNNGISGSWSPAINNTATTTYTFTPNTGQCATTASMTVTVNSASTVPTFTQVPAICSGGSFTLPTISTNGISGSWSPAINNTATTTYTFTPNAGQCGTTTTMTVTVNNATITPTFTQVPAICSGGSFTLPTTSNNGITGVWSPAVNNTVTTTYTFTPNAGQCGTTTTMTVTVNSSVTPTFTQVPAICSGGSFTLPSVSTNGISGTWNPAIDNLSTTTYTFTPNSGQCAVTTTMTVVVNAVNTGTSVQGNTISALATGAGYQWINCLTNQPINGATNASFTPTESGAYAVTVTQNGCSETSDCIVMVVLGLAANTQNGWNVYPNPASDELFVELNEMTEITVVDLTGKTILSERLNPGKNTIQISALSNGVYFLKSESGANVKFVKKL